MWYLANRLPSIPRRPLRIGFEPNAPVQIRTDSGFSGLAVETIDEAAKRAGVRLQWVETGTSSDEAFQKGLVDLWPLMADLPERRKRIHMTQPWLRSNYILLFQAASVPPDRKFTGGIAVFRMPLHVRLVGARFPEARIVQLDETKDILKRVCRGTVSAAFLAARVAETALREKPTECASVGLRVQGLPNMIFQGAVGSSFAAAGAAEAIRREIGGLFRDGTLGVLMAKYSYYGLENDWATLDLMQAAEHARWMAWGISGLGIVLALTLWRVSSLRQRKRADVALRESEDRFRHMSDAAPVMIWVSGPDKLCTFVNKGWLAFTGRTFDEEVGSGWTASLHPDDLNHSFAIYSTSFDARRNFQMEYRLRRTDGEYRWVLDSGVPRFTADGAFAGYVGSCIDVTDLRRTREEALARQKLEGIGVLAGGVAHDFNNILGGILAEAELIETDLPAGSSTIGELQRIKEAAIRGAEIVGQLMIYAGQDQASRGEPVDLSRLVEEMLGLLKVSISKHAVVKTNLGENLPVVWGNAPQIRQVVMNLVINASEAIGDKEGVIQVATSRVTVSRRSALDNATNLPPGEYVLLRVSDTGCGMTEQVRAKILDPFFTTKFVGRGLGLAVVQGIVRDQGGAVEVVSAPGQGATFQVLLSCHSEKALSIQSAVTSSGAEQSNAATGTILLVEDEEVLRLAVSKALRKRGFSVLEACDGSTAMDLIRTHANDIDVIVLDVTLPGMSSREILEETGRIRPELKVILTSAYGKETATAAVAGLQVERFIRKPFQFAELVGELQNALSA
jgi:PAS domain S-box-containing protein